MTFSTAMSVANFWNASEQGTAATVSHVRRIRYKDQTLRVACVEKHKIGPAVRERLIAIMTGKAPDPHGWVEAL